jgi:hypothetical protein
VLRSLKQAQGRDCTRYAGDELEPVVQPFPDYHRVAWLPELAAVFDDDGRSICADTLGWV